MIQTNLTLQSKLEIEKIERLKQEVETHDAEAKLTTQNRENYDFAHSLAVQQENMRQQAHVSPILGATQIDALATLLTPYSGQDVIFHTTLDTTVLRLQATIAAALIKASITSAQFMMDGGALYQGVSVVVHSPQSVPPLAEALALGLTQAGIILNTVTLPTIPEGKVAIYIGPN